MSKSYKYIIIVILLGFLAYFGPKFYSTDPELAAMKALYERNDEVVYPLANPYSEAKYELGKMLFFDTRLSDTNAISCATCHNPAFHWTDSHHNAIGKEHKFVARKSMSLLNLAWDKLYLWNGRAASLEQQVSEALTAPPGMSNTRKEVVQKIQAIPGYRKLFKEVFENERKFYANNNYINRHSIEAAIATFERGIISGQAPFDEWIEGDEDAISQSAKSGFVIFNTKGKCADCHTGWRFSDGEYYNIGLKEKDGIVDAGRGAFVRSDRKALYTFKAVGLRNIDQRPPYMHNGMFKTLEDVIDFYDKGGDLRRKNTKIEKLNLTKQEKADLLAFLKTLTSKDSEVAVPYLPPSF